MITDTYHHYYELCDEDPNKVEDRVDDPYHVTCDRCIRRMLKAASPHKCQCGRFHADTGASLLAVDLSDDPMFTEALKHNFEPLDYCPQDWSFEIRNISMNANRALEIAEGPLFCIATHIEHGWMTQEDVDKLKSSPFSPTRVLHRELAKRLQKMDREQ